MLCSGRVAAQAAASTDRGQDVFECVGLLFKVLTHAFYTFIYTPV